MIKFRTKSGQSTVGLVITGAGAIGASVAFVLSYLNPTIDSISSRQIDDHASIAALSAKIDAVNEKTDLVNDNVKLLIEHQDWYKSSISAPKL